MADLCLLAAQAIAESLNLRSAEPVVSPLTTQVQYRDRTSVSSSDPTSVPTTSTPDRAAMPQFSPQPRTEIASVPLGDPVDTPSPAKLTAPQPKCKAELPLVAVASTAADTVIQATQSQSEPEQVAFQPSVSAIAPSPALERGQPVATRSHVLQPVTEPLPTTPFPPTLFETVRPQSGPQLYAQRVAALRAGRLYTRLTPDSFYDQWRNATRQPSNQQWRSLLTQEANAIAAGQGTNRLTVVVGDSLSLWMPSEWLPQDQFWLNQGISGDTTAGILQRLSAFDRTRPTTIHVMAGINDLKNGVPEAEVVANLHQIMRQLKQRHPQAHIVIHSILPTRWPNLSSDRIQRVNQQVATLAAQEGVDFLNLEQVFADNSGNLRRELTTDGLHLNPSGYQVWQSAIRYAMI